VQVAEGQAPVSCIQFTKLKGLQAHFMTVFKEIMDEESGIYHGYDDVNPQTIYQQAA
jgi:hypothetical protein